MSRIGHQDAASAAVDDGRAQALNDAAGMPDELEADDNADQAAQVTNSLYPAAPTVFDRFTKANVARYEVLKKAKEDDERSGAFDWWTADPSQRIDRQREVLERAETERASSSDADEKSSLLPAPEWDVLLAMEPPRVDWVEEQGAYTCFGEQWPVVEVLPTLQEMGMTQIYPDAAAPLDRRAVLTTLLRTMLKSYLGLVDVLLAAPDEYLATEHDPATGQIVSQQWRFASQDKAREINDLSINFMHLLNESRPLQAREQLRDLMREQLLQRRQEASLMKSQCTAMRREVESIRQRLHVEAEKKSDSL